MVGDGADAHADAFQVVLVGVQAAEVLRERLAEAVEGIRARWHVWADALAGEVEAGDVVADVSAEELFAWLGGSQWGDVQQAQRGEAAAESVAQDRTQPAGGAGDEDSMHQWFP